MAAYICKMNQNHLETVDLLLASMSTDVGEDGMMHQFNASGDSHRVYGIYVTVYFSRRKLISAALYAHAHGASYLRDLPISEIQSLLTDFAKTNYPLCSASVPFCAHVHSFLEHSDEVSRQRLAEAIASSPIFSPPSVLVLFPLVTVRAEGDFSSPAFFLRKPETLPQEFAPPPSDLEPTTFPPIVDPRMRIERPASWLGFRAANLTSAKKMARSVLGALALTQSHSYRHMFSGRTVWGGYCLFNRGWSFGFDASLTPAVMEDITVTEADREWFAIMAELLASDERSERRKLSALQYYYRAWELDPSERFPNLCMALEALFGDANRATAAVIDGINSAIGPLDAKRLRMLMDIRASVIHGGAPDVYDSRKYGKYFRTYGDDPIRDMGLVVAGCLRAKIFGCALAEHAEPHQEIVVQQQEAGRLPRRTPHDAVLDRTEALGSEISPDEP